MDMGMEMDMADNMYRHRHLLLHPHRHQAALHLRLMHHTPRNLDRVQLQHQQASLVLLPLSGVN